MSKDKLLGLPVAVFLLDLFILINIPMIIIAGPIYRGHLYIMTILFISTIVLSGPAWCSHLCYFGAIDSISAAGRSKGSPIRYKWALKTTVLLLVIAGTIVLRWFKVSTFTATFLALGFGVIGLGLVLLVSRKAGKMVHCTAYCPIGTIVNLARFINPFRLKIDQNNCTDCMACKITE
jgi:ferredoxin-type protein NapH